MDGSRMRGIYSDGSNIGRSEQSSAGSSSMERSTAKKSVDLSKTIDLGVTTSDLRKLKKQKNKVYGRRRSSVHLESAASRFYHDAKIDESKSAVASSSVASSQGGKFSKYPQANERAPETFTRDYNNKVMESSRNNSVSDQGGLSGSKPSRRASLDRMDSETAVVIPDSKISSSIPTRRASLADHRMDSESAVVNNQTFVRKYDPSVPTEIIQNQEDQASHNEYMNGRDSRWAGQSDDGHSRQINDDRSYVGQTEDGYSYGGRGHTEDVHTYGSVHSNGRSGRLDDLRTETIRMQQLTVNSTDAGRSNHYGMRQDYNFEQKLQNIQPSSSEMNSPHTGHENRVRRHTMQLSSMNQGAEYFRRNETRTEDRLNHSGRRSSLPNNYENQHPSMNQGAEYFRRNETRTEDRFNHEGRRSSLPISYENQRQNTDRPISRDDTSFNSHQRDDRGMGREEQLTQQNDNRDRRHSGSPHRQKFPTISEELGDDASENGQSHRSDSHQQSPRRAYAELYNDFISRTASIPDYNNAAEETKMNHHRTKEMSPWLEHSRDPVRRRGSNESQYSNKSNAEFNPMDEVERFELEEQEEEKQMMLAKEEIRRLLHRYSMNTSRNSSIVTAVDKMKIIIEEFVAFFNETNKQEGVKPRKETEILIRLDDLMFTKHLPASPFPWELLQIIQLFPGNDKCCDCGDEFHGKPSFGSPTYGTLLCKPCAFRHIDIPLMDDEEEVRPDIIAFQDKQWTLPNIIAMLEGCNKSLSDFLHKNDKTKKQRRSSISSESKNRRKGPMLQSIEVLKRHSLPHGVSEDQVLTADFERVYSSEIVSSYRKILFDRIQFVLLKKVLILQKLY